MIKTKTKAKTFWLNSASKGKYKTKCGSIAYIEGSGRGVSPPHEWYGYIIGLDTGSQLRWDQFGRCRGIGSEGYDLIEKIEDTPEFCIEVKRDTYYKLHNGEKAFVGFIKPALNNKDKATAVGYLIDSGEVCEWNLEGKHRYFDNSDGADYNYDIVAEWVDLAKGKVIVNIYKTSEGYLKAETLLWLDGEPVPLSRHGTETIASTISSWEEGAFVSWDEDESKD